MKWVGTTFDTGRMQVMLLFVFTWMSAERILKSGKNFFVIFIMKIELERIFVSEALVLSHCSKSHPAFSSQKKRKPNVRLQLFIF